MRVRGGIEDAPTGKCGSPLPPGIRCAAELCEQVHSGRITIETRPGATKADLLRAVKGCEALRDALMPEDAERLQPIPPLHVKGKRAPVRAFAWLHDADRGTLTAPTSQLGSVAAAHQAASRLLLSCNGVTVEVRKEQDATLGRDPANDLPIPSTRASRHHARVYFQGGHFFVEDQSSNGTWIEAEDLPPFRIHRDRAPLLGQGRILCGADPAKAVVPEVTFARD